MRLAGIGLCLFVVLQGCGKSNPATDAGARDAAARDGLAADAAKVCPKGDAGVPASCAADKLEVFKGKHFLVINKLAIGAKDEGFDMNNRDCDYNNKTGADNALWPIGAIAQQALDESVDRGEVVIPLEFFGLDDAKNDSCFNLSLYVGRFPNDGDDDGAKTGGPINKPGPDCNDTDPNIGNKKKEIAGNGVDDDCDGLADEDESTTPATPSKDTKDADGDGQTIADGDCDDRPGIGAKSKKGGVEICGDGLDNDCNGKADDGCLPWTPKMTYPIESAALDANRIEALVSFRGARLVNGKIYGGPSGFRVTVPIRSNIILDLNLTNVYLEADYIEDAKGPRIENGILGGVLSAAAMDSSPNFIAEIGGGFGSKDSSLLDAVVGPAGALLGLPIDAKGNRIPDVDVDGDGIEVFLDKDLDGDKTNFKVDTCIDGDGTVIEDKRDATGKVIEPCTQAKDKNGKPRFVDGWSISFKFSAVPSTPKGIVNPKP